MDHTSNLQYADAQEIKDKIKTYSIKSNCLVKLLIPFFIPLIIYID